MIIPGVGKKTSEDLLKLRLKSIEDLNGKTPRNYIIDFVQLKRRI